MYSASIFVTLRLLEKKITRANYYYVHVGIRRYGRDGSDSREIIQEYVVPFTGRREIEHVHRPL